MKKIVLVVFAFIAFSAVAQNPADYKYIVVPAKFGIFKDANKYNMNALTKGVFEKQGYEVYYDTDTLPQELAENRCKALYADMVENNTLFMTKIRIELKDCKNQVVYVSQQGESREKEYAKAYIQSFRTVGKSLESLKSNPQKTVVVPDQPRETVTETVATVYATAALTVKPIQNGYQISDANSQMVMTIYRTSVANVFMAVKGTVQGVLVSSNESWIFEYYRDNILISEHLNLKF